MGYTHYYTIHGNTLDGETFQRFSRDCAKVCRASEIPLAGWDGTGEPTFSEFEVAFNGRRDCGHKQQDLGITWPARDAAGGVDINHQPTESWFGGASLLRRTCGGDCSHETFRVTCTRDRRDYQPKQGERFGFCKTAYKPYDIPVTACLIILKHHFGSKVNVSSDGESRDWDDARILCQQVLGYGEEFVL